MALNLMFNNEEHKRKLIIKKLHTFNSEVNEYLTKHAIKYGVKVKSRRKRIVNNTLPFWEVYYISK